MKKVLVLCLLGVLGVAGLSFSYSKRSACFSPSFALSNHLFYHENGSLPPGIDQILQQPFSFLGSGNQSFAFESQDKKTVLKLFKFHCLQGFDFYDLIPSWSFFKTLKKTHSEERQKKIDRLIGGLVIANTYNRTHSGIIYLHFPPSEFFDREVYVQDKAGRKHLLPIDSYVFILQHKAIPLGEVLKTLLEKGDVTGANEKLTTLFSMFSEDLSQGLYDHDHNVIANTGFTEDQPMRIDFGKLSLNPEMKKLENRQKEIKKIADERISPWVKRFFPEHADSIAKNLEIIQKYL